MRVRGSLDRHGRRQLLIADELHQPEELRPLLGRKGERFDVIFADPPYEQSQAGEALRLIRSLSVLAEGGVVVVQHGSREDIPAAREGFRVDDERRYGETQLSFLRLAEPADRTTTVRPDGR